MPVKSAESAEASQGSCGSRVAGQQGQTTPSNPLVRAPESSLAPEPSITTTITPDHEDRIGGKPSVPDEVTYWPTADVVPARQLISSVTRCPDDLALSTGGVSRPWNAMTRRREVGGVLPTEGKNLAGGVRRRVSTIEAAVTHSAPAVHTPQSAVRPSHRSHLLARKSNEVPR